MLPHIDIESCTESENICRRFMRAGKTLDPTVAMKLGADIYAGVARLHDDDVMLAHRE